MCVCLRGDLTNVTLHYITPIMRLIVVDASSCQFQRSCDRSILFEKEFTCSLFTYSSVVYLKDIWNKFRLFTSFHFPTFSNVSTWGACGPLRRILAKTSSSAIAERPRCSVGQLWRKYQCCCTYSQNIAVDCCCSYFHLLTGSG